MEAFTAIPVAQRPPKMLTEMLAELDEIPGVLIVFNHPIWDLYRIGQGEACVPCERIPGGEWSVLFMRWS